jgi:alpha-glucosidase
VFFLAALGSQAVGLEANSNPVLLNTFTSSKALPNGLEVTSGSTVEQIVALRDDVVRVRIGVAGQLPEDASWAVLPEARTSSASITADDSAESAGFCTRLICARVERTSLRLRITDKQGNVLQEDATTWPTESNGKAFRIYKRMPADEHYYGLGDKVGPLDRRNQSFTLWNSDAYKFEESTDPIYKSIPFFLTLRQGRSIGVLLDNTWRSSFDFGKLTRDTYSFGAEGGPIDYYVLYGPEPKQVLSTYAWLTGYTPLPPQWTLGYQQSRYSYESESRVREIVDTLRKHRIPTDAIYLDIEFQEKNRPFTVNTTAFPSFAKMLADLKQQQFHVVAITDLHIASVPDSNYEPYNSGRAGDHFVKNPDGSIYVGQVWPGASVFPDFSQQRSREWWGGLYKGLLNDGAAGFWNDMNEPSVFDGPGGTMPDNTKHRIDEPGFAGRTADHAEMHNVYGMLNSRATFEGLMKLAPNMRPFVLTRATYAGGHRYAATWTGDNSSTWNHLRLTMPMLLNLGLSGFGLTGADVGGFVGTPQPELLTKWMEVAAFQPIDRNHTDKASAAQEPWANGPEHEGIRRRYIEERYRLMPYIYTTAEEMSRTGVPMMRPIFLEYPKVPSEVPVDLMYGSSFLLGSDLLVAPAPSPDKLDRYPVLFPTDEWYDYWTGSRVAFNPVPPMPNRAVVPSLMIAPTLADLPVFVRGGAIIPIQPLTQSTEDTPKGPLTLRVYPGSQCKGSLYMDDGKSLKYKQGEFLRMQFTCDAKADSIKVNISGHEGRYTPWWKQLRLEVFGVNAAEPRVSVNGQKASATLNSNAKALTFEIDDSGRGAEIEILTQ